MKILVACEESQAVTIEFRKLGYEAYSCDILPPSGGHREWHIQGDALKVINGRCSFVTMDGVEHFQHDQWDMLIAHPPCTYLSNAGARFLYPKGVLNEERLRNGLKAKDFFLRFWWADCERICVENPVPSSVYCMPPYTQTVQPYEHGHPLKKKTCFWLKNLPELKPSNPVPLELCQSTKISGNWFNHGGKDRQGNRAKTFPGIARAMAEQWSEQISINALNPDGATSRFSPDNCKKL